jgi:hypothetical protein
MMNLFDGIRMGEDDYEMKIREWRNGGKDGGGGGVESLKVKYFFFILFYR